MKKILAINLGSSSTKIAYYEDENCIFNENISHAPDVIRSFPDIWSQLDFRKQQIVDFLKEKNLKISDMDAVVTRGGHTHPIPGGVYHITDQMLKESRSEKYGNHPTDLGLVLANEFSHEGPKAFTVDPPSTDEFEPLARYSGLAGIKRRSSFHILNQRAVGLHYAKTIGKMYSDLNLIIVHMGGGISVGVHKKGKIIDGNNAIDGDGPFSTNRCCSVPIGDLIRLCYSGKYSYADMIRMITREGGLMSYVGDNDAKRVQEKALSGDQKCLEVMQAMCYQVAKEIGADATVLDMNVDAILITGGMAHSDWITGMIKERVQKIAPVVILPGEYEMQSLALHTLQALNGEAEIKEL